ncbi:AAA family ATPase [Burkholderia diffusa]|uniref:AAA family ATPase n=1 Tax=Burkholderia diffusa TaxID=488732 RepID=UPI0034A05BAC
MPDSTTQISRAIKCAAAQHGCHAAKALLRDRRPFVWNATHLSPLMRKKTLDLLVAYGADVTLVYLEQPRAELLCRNARHDTSLTNRALEAMLLRWDLPLPTEVHAVRYEV